MDLTAIVGAAEVCGLPNQAITRTTRFRTQQFSIFDCYCGCFGAGPYSTPSISQETTSFPGFVNRTLNRCS